MSYLVGPVLFALVILGSLVFLLAEGMVAALLSTRHDDETTWFLIYVDLFLALDLLNFMVVFLALGYLWLAAIAAGFIGLCLWMLWDHWRRRKGRKPSRVLGVVRDLGGRLGIVNV